MKKCILAVSVAILLGFFTSAVAELFDNGDGTITQKRPDGSGLMWLKDTNYAGTTGVAPYGTLTLSEARNWVETLVFAGHDDWRLPRIPETASPISHFDYEGEMGILYHIELGNDTLNPWDTPTNTGPFLDFPSVYFTYYWYDRENYELGYDGAFVFHTLQGSSGVSSQYYTRYVWPVRDLSPTPKEATEVITDDLDNMIQEYPDQDKLKDAREKLKYVLNEFDQEVPDVEKILGDIEGTVGELHAAFEENPYGEYAEEVIQLTDQLAAIARRLVVNLLDRLPNPNCKEISEAEKYLAQGDEYIDLGEFKKAVGEYKAAYDKAEDCLS